MKVEYIKRLFPNGASPNLKELSDDAILKEVDDRGLHMGVSYADLTLLVHLTKNENWPQLRTLVARLARENLGRIV